MSTSVAGSVFACRLDLITAAKSSVGGGGKGLNESMKLPALRLGLICLSTLFCCEASAQQHASDSRSQPLILAHYMPWYVAKPVSRVWGWHWTMSHFDPDKEVDGRRAIASHFYPLIGPYDSGDEDVLEYHLLLMKLAGIDGVIVDWYGQAKLYDYPILHHNTQRLVKQVERLGMKVVICYEDQTIPALVKAGKVRAEDRVAHAVAEIDWLADNWFTLDSYVQLDGRPVLLSFGHAGLTNDEWSQCLTKLKLPVSYFSEHFRRDGAQGGFDWPIPKEGLQATERFRKSAAAWSHSIPVAFPRFVDIYQEAKLHDSYGRIEDKDGTTFKVTLEQALTSHSRIVQLATWNDWGEGTNIEPCREFGYRDLEIVQDFRRKYVDATFARKPANLRLPIKLLERRREASNPAQESRLDEVAEFLATGKTSDARVALESLTHE